MTRSDRPLAWIILGVIACAAILGFGRGLSQALADAPLRRIGLGGATSAPDGGPRLATALPALDEGRVRQIAREEAEAAVARARPRRPVAPKSAPDANITDDTPPAPGAAPDAAPPAP